MSAPHHFRIDVLRWHNQTLLFQMGNIGSEIGRALRARSLGQRTNEEFALHRALELFHLTIIDPKHRGRRRELCRAREVVCDFFCGDNAYASSAEKLDAYFLAFGAAAQYERRKRV